MLDLRLICEALADTIRAGTARSVACYALVPPTAPQYPCCIVRSPAGQFVSYHESFGDAPLTDVRLEVMILHQGKTDVDSQIVVLDLLSSGAGKTSSVVDAIESDRTLGGLVEDTVTRTATGLSRSSSEDGSAAVMAIVNVDIKTRRG
jgi:hypothetical protein